MTVPKPLRADAQRSRNALLATARTVFNTGDFDLRFDDFAQLAGVGVGTLYRHFPTREALIEGVYHQEIVTLCDQASHLQATLPAEEALTTFLRDLINHMDAHQGLARTLAILMATRVEAIAEGTQLLERTVTELMVAAVNAGAIRDDIDAGAVMMAIHSIGSARDHPGWRTLADGVVTLVLDGLRPH